MLYPNVTLDGAFESAADTAWSIVYPHDASLPMPDDDLLQEETENAQRSNGSVADPDLRRITITDLAARLHAITAALMHAA